MVIESNEKIPVYDINDQLIVPQIIYKDDSNEEIQAITYTVNGIKYHLSNGDGHKVYRLGTIAAPRPMTKKEFKELCKTLILNFDKYDDIGDTILAIVDQLDFQMGHANSTFEIVKSCVDPRPVGTLVMNIGTARYLYNQDVNSVFHIDHTKFISGHMLQEPEKERIISKIKTSKTMTKKIQHALNS